MYMYNYVQRVNGHLFEKSFTDVNTKTLNTYEKLWLANWASHNMALAGPTAFWLALGHREARPLVICKDSNDCLITIYE